MPASSNSTQAVANFVPSGDDAGGESSAVRIGRWIVLAVCAVAFVVALVAVFDGDERELVPNAATAVALDLFVPGHAEAWAGE